MTMRSLLSILADGRFHSGNELGEALQVSRSAVWKQIKRLEECGLEIYSVKGRGYRLPGGLDLLDQPSFEQNLRPEVARQLGHKVFDLSTDSTNQQAMEYALRNMGHGALFTAEQQTAGRGRRGREWVSPFASNLYFSLVWRFQRGAAALEGLSLVVGLALARSLTQFGVPALQLKWPNDLLADGRKLAGILLEMSGDVAGDCQVVIGVGLNVRMAEKTDIDQPWTDLQTLTGNGELSRSEVLAVVMNELVPMLKLFSEQGFAPFRESWQQYHAYQDEPVKLLMGSQQEEGVCVGVNESGAILLKTPAGTKAYHGGEVSLRPQG